MPSSPNTIKGYIKTEQMILFVAIALSIGFVCGVLFSTYKATRQMPAQQLTASTDAAPMSPEQQQTLKTLLDKTKSNPKDVDAWTRLGHLYFDHGQHDLAVDAYVASLELDAQRPDVWTDLGVMYRRKGEPHKAIESFEHALSANPNHQIALFNKGVVMMHDIGDPKGAIAAWEALVEINPKAKTPSGQFVHDLVEELKKNISS